MPEKRYDPRSSISGDHELRFPREPGFLDKSLLLRILIVLCFVTTLFIYLHFREERVDILELNTKAPRYVVAQVDFDFIDEEATLILRQESVADVGKIYALNQDQIEKRRKQFEDDLLYKEEWRDLIHKGEVETIYKGLSILSNALIQMRLTDPRTFQKMNEYHIPTTIYQVFSTAAHVSQTELPQGIWEELRTHYLPEKFFQSSIATFLIGYFKNQQWILAEDISAEKEVRKAIQSSIPERTTHIHAGSRIIDQGEKVTLRHLAMLQAMKEVLSSQRNLWHPMTFIGTFLMTIILTGVSGFYLHFNYPQVLHSNRRLGLLVTIILMTLIFAKAVEYFLVNSTNSLFDLVRYPLLLPFAVILTTNLLSAGMATFVMGALGVLFTMVLAFNPSTFLLINVITALVAILSTRSLTKRKEIFIVSIKAWISCFFIIISYHCYDNTFFSWKIIADFASTAAFMAMTSVLVLGILPLLEGSFGIMSDVSLMEYLDPNHELLRRLSFEIPGTYQHTLVVCNIAEGAAQAIGANSLFCRVATLYHDIGKMATPQFFTENQEEGMDVHKLLTPIESSQAIMAHVTEGVVMARKAGLPEQFIDIIKEHHGTTLVYYFYRKQLEKMGGDLEKVEERDFRYSGPKPRSKESVIIMIADSFEAASRSLDKVDEVTLTELINRLIQEKAEDGQFDNCLLTFEELGIIKRAMVKTLSAAYHSRIKYPVRLKTSHGIETYG